MVVDSSKDGMEAQSTSIRSFVSPWRLARILFARRWWLVSAVVVTAVLGATYLLLQPNVYTSRAVILPSGESAGIGSLKDLVGLTGISMVEENSSALYPVILNSAHLRDAMLADTFSFTHGGEERSLTIADYLKTEDRDRLHRNLGSVLRVSTSARTGEIVITAETRYPRLSQMLLERQLELLEEYNQQRRQSSARNNRDYLADQATEASHTLALIEDSLLVFQQANRDWTSSGDPEAMLTIGRLQREIEIQSTGLAYLRQQLEIARFETTKDIPVVRILDAPHLPSEKSGPQRTMTLALILLVVGAATVVTILLIDVARPLVLSTNDADSRALNNEVVAAFPRTVKLVNRLTQRTKMTDTFGQTDRKTKTYESTDA